MRTLSIYFRTIRFNFGRILYTFLGILAFLITLVLVFALGRLILRRDSYVFATIGAALGIFVLWFVRRRKTGLYKMGERALITNAVLTGKIEKGYFKNSMEEARRVFGGVSIIGMIFRTTAGIGRLLTGKSSKAKKEEYKSRIATLALMMATNLIPYIGSCIQAWIYSHKDKTLLQNSLEGLAVYKGNKKKILWPALLCFFIDLVVLFAAIMLMVLMMFYLDSKFNITGAIEYVESTTGKSPYGLEVLLAAIGVYIAFFLNWLVTMPISRIILIRRFLKIGLENPPTSEIYSKLMKFRKTESEINVMEEK